MDRDPRENDGRMVPDRGESGEPEGKADGEKSTEKCEERCGRRGGGDEQDRESRTGTAPEETPMMSGDASGFRKTVW